LLIQYIPFDVLVAALNAANALQATAAPAVKKDLRYTLCREFRLIEDSVKINHYLCVHSNVITIKLYTLKFQ
jgi:hypothetical protein